MFSGILYGNTAEAPVILEVRLPLTLNMSVKMKAGGKLASVAGFSIFPQMFGVRLPLAIMIQDSKSMCFGGR